MECNWKENWLETKENFRKWWNHEGFVIGGWYGVPSTSKKADVKKPEELSSTKEKYLNAVYRARLNHFRIANSTFPVDTLPIAETNIAPGALSLFLGAEAEFSQDAVWLHSSEKYNKETEEWSSFKIEQNNYYLDKQVEILEECRKLSEGKYLVGLTDLVQNIDTLDTLRGTGNLMMDFLTRPDWIKEKVDEITKAWFEVFDILYDIIRLEDGSMAVDCFRIFAPGKTAMLQCDAAGMISGEMFDDFVLPSIKSSAGF